MSIQRIVEFDRTAPVSGIRDHILKEGVELTGARFSYNTTLARTPTIGSVNTPLLSGQYDVPLGRVLWLQGIQVSADRPVRISGRITNGQHSQPANYLNGTSTLFGGSTGKFAHQWQISCDKFLFEGGFIAFTISSLEAGQEPPMIEMSILGMEATNDLNYAAKNVILVAGDSITHWGLGNDNAGFPFCGKDLYANRIATKLNQLGYSTRVIHKGIRGSTSREGRYGLIDGYYDSLNWNVLMVGYGTNDAAAALNIPTTEVKENLGAFISWRNSYHPGKPIILLAPGSQDKTGYAENVAAYRTAIQEVATTTTYGGSVANNVHYLDASTVFGLNATPTADTNFQNSERSLNNRLHWSGYGHGLVADALWNNSTIRSAMVAAMGS